MIELKCKECNANLILRDSRFYCGQCGLESDLQKFGSKKSKYTGRTTVLNGTVIGNRKERWNPQVIKLRRTHARFCSWLNKKCIICQRSLNKRQIKYCSVCKPNEYRKRMRKYNKRRYYLDPQKANERSREWRRKNLEKDKIIHQIYYQKNRSEIRMKHKEYYQKNREELLVKRRERYWKGVKQNG